MEIEALIACPEGKTLEFKRDLSSPEGLLRTISAFGNTAGGTVVIGVESRDRSIRGIDDALDQEERLANLISDSIRPQIVVEIEIVTYRSKSLLLARVFPGPARPYHLARHGPESGSYVRVGSTNRRVGPEVLAELRRANTNSTFDEQLLPDLDSEAIDFRAAAEQFEPIRRLRRTDLRALGITCRSGNRDVPTVGGVLLFGKARTELFPDAVIELARFEGRDRTELLDMQTFDAIPVRAVEQALLATSQQTRKRFTIQGARRQSIGIVPESALREALVNAVVHTDYSQSGSRIRIGIYADRVEIENPGLLPFGVTIEDIRSGHSKLRNRVMGRVFHALGLIEQWGTGVQRIIAGCRDAGIAEPRFEELGTHFRVTLPFERFENDGVKGRDAEILDLLGKTESLSTAQLAKALGLTTRAIRTRMARLVDTGLVAVVAVGPNDPGRRYRLPPRR
ncbi:MAG: ATP-binding protein [Planctomycetota bacterium]